jgi:hypothetical protein
VPTATHMFTGKYILASSNTTDIYARLSFPRYPPRSIKRFNRKELNSTGRSRLAR